MFSRLSAPSQSLLLAPTGSPFHQRLFRSQTGCSAPTPPPWYVPSSLHHRNSLSILLPTPFPVLNVPVVLLFLQLQKSKGQPLS